jgi:hypothetical protein
VDRDKNHFSHHFETSSTNSHLLMASYCRETVREPLALNWFKNKSKQLKAALSWLWILVRYTSRISRSYRFTKLSPVLPDEFSFVGIKLRKTQVLKLQETFKHIQRCQKSTGLGLGKLRIDLSLLWKSSSEEYPATTLPFGIRIKRN